MAFRNIVLSEQDWQDIRLDGLAPGMTRERAEEINGWTYVDGVLASPLHVPTNFRIPRSLADFEDDILMAVGGLTLSLRGQKLLQRGDPLYDSLVKFNFGYNNLLENEKLDLSIMPIVDREREIIDALYLSTPSWVARTARRQEP